MLGHVRLWMYKTFITIPKAVPIKLCDEMVKESPDYSEQLAGVMWKKEADLKKDRNSKIKWYPLEHWIVPKLCEVASQINKQDYGFDVTNLQCPQFTEYTKGQHYQWHRDIYPPEMDGPYPGLIRKLSMIVQLSNFEDYKGGILQIKNMDGKIEPIEGFKDKGDMIIFPSFYLHRIKAVTEGTRHSLVCWFMGPPFR